MTRRTNPVVALACVASSVLLGGVGDVDADDRGTWISKWSNLLAEGRYTDAANMVTPDVAPDLIAAPENAYEVARIAARYLHGASRKGMDDTRENADWFVRMAEATLEKTPDSPGAFRAVAAAYAAKARIAGVVGAGILPADWNEVAQKPLASYDQPLSDDRGKASAEAAGWLRGAIGWKDLDPGEILRHVEAVAAKAETFGKGEHVSLAKAELELARANVSLSTKASDAAAAVQRCLALLDPIVTGAQPTPAANTHADAVTFARLHRLGKPAYKMVGRESSSALLRYGYPLCDRWKPHRGETPPPESIAAVQELNEHRQSRRNLMLMVYDATKDWGDRDAGLVTGVSNLKGMAGVALGLEKKNFDAVTREKGPVKAQVGKALPPMMAFELEGRRPDGSDLRVRGWFFKAKETASVFGIRVLDYGVDSAPDPELDAFLESIAEIKKK